MVELLGKEIIYVYTCREDGCRCGCRGGKYRYASSVAAKGKELRGYAIDADEVSDREVKRIANIIAKNMDKADEVKPGDNNINVTMESGRVYTAYFE